MKLPTITWFGHSFYQQGKALTQSPSSTTETAHDSSKKSTRAILVLGCPVNADGTPGPGLLCRLQRALGMAQDDVESLLIVSGGNPHGLCEAVAMKTWLVDHGVDPARIHLESEAYSTVENAEFSAPILRNLGVSEVAVVTERFHLHRGTTLVKKALAARNIDTITVTSVAANDHLSPKSATALRASDESKVSRDLLYQQEMHKRINQAWPTADTFEVEKLPKQASCNQLPTN